LRLTGISTRPCKRYRSSYLAPSREQLRLIATAPTPLRHALISPDASTLHAFAANPTASLVDYQLIGHYPAVDNAPMFSTPAASFFPVGGIDRNNTSIDFSGLQPQPRTSTTPSHASDGNFNDLSETLASCHASPIAQSESRTPSAGRAPAVSGSHPPRQQLDSKRPHHNHHSTMCVCHRCTFVKIAQLTAALANLNRHAQHLAFTKHNRISTSTRCFGSPMSLTLLHHISRPRATCRYSWARKARITAIRDSRTSHVPLVFRRR